ncbi:MAG: hypothetical protein GEU79_05845 [Acidimicrobiia bacterium]|nr:hypothetical protein [Acidimicrobiia bacterium]
MIRIAIIGWGSLIWSPRELSYHGPWTPNGPILPIEFSRIASDGRLTLIIDENHGEMIPTWSAIARQTNLDGARKDLAAREGCPLDRIGWTERHGIGDNMTGGVVADWCATTGWDGAVWTQLPSTFEERTGEPFSVAAALSYLDGLSADTQERAIEYIEKVPATTDTPLRRAWAARS